MLQPKNASLHFFFFGEPFLPSNAKAALAFPVLIGGAQLEIGREFTTKGQICIFGYIMGDWSNDVDELVRFVRVENGTNKARQSQLDRFIINPYQYFHCEIIREERNETCRSNQ